MVKIDLIAAIDEIYNYYDEFADVSQNNEEEGIFSVATIKVALIRFINADIDKFLLYGSNS